jgi:hypothetical protein
MVFFYQKKPFDCNLQSTESAKSKADSGFFGIRGNSEAGQIRQWAGFAGYADSKKSCQRGTAL